MAAGKVGTYQLATAGQLLSFVVTTDKSSLLIGSLCVTDQLRFVQPNPLVASCLPDWVAAYLWSF